MKVKYLLLAIITALMIISCEKEENEIQPEDTSGQEDALIGDWVFTWGQANYIYRFQDDGTVLIGRDDFFDRNFIEHIYGSQQNSIKFYYQSSWAIDNNSLNIEGDIFTQYDILFEGAETSTLWLEHNLFRNIANNNKENFDRTNNNSSNYDKAYDLSQAQINTSSLNGKWIKSSGYGPETGGGMEILNGQVVAHFLYNVTTGIMTDMSELYEVMPISYSVKSPDFPGQALGREIYNHGINPFGEFYSNTYYIIDFTLDESGKLIYMVLNKNANVQGSGLSGGTFVRIE